jgi:hypothetical protein
MLPRDPTAPQKRPGPRERRNIAVLQKAERAAERSAQAWQMAKHEILETRIQNAKLILSHRKDRELQNIERLYKDGKNRAVFDEIYASARGAGLASAVKKGLDKDDMKTFLDEVMDFTSQEIRTRKTKKKKKSQPTNPPQKSI